MFSRKELKKAARGSLKRRYLVNVVLVFLVSLLATGGYQSATRNERALSGAAQSAGEELAALAGEPPGAQLSAAAELGRSRLEARAEALREDARALSARTNTLQGISNAEILEDLLQGAGVLKPPRENPGLARRYTRGVLSVFVNAISSAGSFGFGVLNGVNQLLFGGSVSASVLIFLFAGLHVAFFFLVRNVFVVGQCRYFLEHRRYADTRPDRLTLPFRVGRGLNAAWIMLCRFFWLLLWLPTVFGFAVRYYETLLVPWIVAENPGISRKDAFALSRRLMLGEKRAAFLLDLSLLPWAILSAFTYNLAGLFFLEPYRQCIGAELYMTLRGAKRAALPEGAFRFDDALDPPSLLPGPYPEEACLCPPRPGRAWLTVDYRKSYSPEHLLLLFFTFSFVGWVWEVLLHLSSTGVFVNRGVLHGPWLPIYGTGGVLILLVLRPLRDRPLHMFLGAFALCGALEYGTAWALETFLGQRWWDYEGYFMNLHGRICLEGLLVFGLAGLAFTYVFSPMLDNLFARIPARVKRPLCLLLSVLFVADAGASALFPNTGEGVTTEAPKVP